MPGRPTDVRQERVSRAAVDEADVPGWARGRFAPPEAGELCRGCPDCGLKRIPVSRPRKKRCYVCDHDRQSSASTRAKRRARARDTAPAARRLAAAAGRRPLTVQDTDRLRAVYSGLYAAAREAARIAAPGGAPSKNPDLLVWALEILLDAFATAADGAAPILFPTPTRVSLGRAGLAGAARRVLASTDPAVPRRPGDGRVVGRP